MIHLDVWITFPDGAQHRAGELVTTDPEQTKGAIEGEFRYSDLYLSFPSAFALDPCSLPLIEGIFSADRPHSGIHGVFEDALPDDWGRKLLVHRYALPRTEQRAANLLRYLGNNGLGALAFSEEAPTLPTAIPPVSELVRLLAAARAFEAGEPIVEDEFTLLFQAGSSPGGARPKAMLHDGVTAWIAKFPSIKDNFDVVRIEAATMTLAQNAGLEIPQFKVVELGKRAAFLIRRFDVTELGRYHQISLQTLLKADGYYTLGYIDVAKTLRRYVARPTEDLAKLYLQMIFNVMIGNTDDHLKNFALLHDENGYRLSPAFDLLPNIGQNSEHVLRFGLHADSPSRQILLDMSPSFNLKTLQAEALIEQVAQTVSNWQAEFINYDVPRKDIERLGKDIESRLQKLGY